MAEPTLAPRHLQHQVHLDQDAAVNEDPFASPALSEHLNSPTHPPPCAHPSQHQRRMPPSAADSEANKKRHDRQASASLPHKSASMSSSGDSTVITPMSSMDLEKVRFDHAQESERERERSREPKRESRASSKRESRRSHRHSRDPEKAMHSGRNSPNRAANNTSLTYEEEDDDDEDFTEGKRKQEEKALKILFFMSGPCVLLSFVNSVWGLIAILITCLTQPIRLCATRPTFGLQLSGLLGPTLNLQLKCIYTPLSPHANEDGSYHSGMLFVVHMLSPFLSMAVMFASWVLGFYWLCSGVVGDPAGQDKRDDGKETVLGLRNWWEKWLMKGVKEV